MELHERIHSAREIVGRKPVVKGTHLSVESRVGLSKVGWTDEMIFESYPRLTAKDLQAVKQYPQHRKRRAAGASLYSIGTEDFPGDCRCPIRDAPATRLYIQVAARRPSLL